MKKEKTRTVKQPVRKLGNWGGTKQKQVACRRIMNDFSSWLRKTEAGKREEMAEEVAEVFSEDLHTFRTDGKLLGLP